MSADRDGRVLDALFAVIEERKAASPDSSYTAKLLAAGTAKTARKVGEEAVEVVVAALGERDRLAAESADLLYHLLVLWAGAGVKPEEVWTELARRQGTSGLAEKASRGRDAGAG
jgi:phosphoribosyl-ATP pyrophosphohydrolase